MDIKFESNNSSSTLFPVHLIPPSLSVGTALAHTAFSFASLLVDELHLSDGDALCFADALHVHHGLVLCDDFFLNLGAQRILDTEPDFNVVLCDE